MKLLKKILALGVVALGIGAHTANAESIQGTYKALLTHENTTYVQFATITLRTVNTGSNLKISANVRMLFGDWNSNEFLTYDFQDVPMNILTRQISVRSDTADVSFIGTLKNGEISGDWHASSVGRVGKFIASKTTIPTIPNGSELVRTVTGHYLGSLKNTNPNSNLPERVTVSLVTTQDTSSPGSNLKITGNMRFYLGDFGTSEYVESKLSSVEYNFYNRYLTAKTEEFGITFKGLIAIDGRLQADVYADGLGKVGVIDLEAQ